jgi:hypothetical protein
MKSLELKMSGIGITATHSGMEQIFIKMLGIQPKKEYNAFHKIMHRVLLMSSSDIETSGEKEGK